LEEIDHNDSEHDSGEREPHKIDLYVFDYSEKVIDFISQGINPLLRISADLY